MDTVKKLYTKSGIDPGNSTKNMEEGTLINVILVR